MSLDEETEENLLRNYCESHPNKEYEDACIILPKEFKNLESFFKYCERRSRTKRPTFIEEYIRPLKQLVGEHNYDFSEHIVGKRGFVIYSIPNVNMRKILKIARR